MTLTFACGHRQTLNDPKTPPVCACGERRISRVAAPDGRPLRAPTFRGTCQGPSAITETLGPVPVPMGQSHG